MHGVNLLLPAKGRHAVVKHVGKGNILPINIQIMPVAMHHRLNEQINNFGGYHIFFMEQLDPYQFRIDE
ncbi:hypothetical protein D3C85_1353220 [compost metagenome]